MANRKHIGSNEYMALKGYLIELLNIGVSGRYHRHLPQIYNLTKEINAQVVLELNREYGYATIALLCGVEETGGVVYSCDTTYNFHPLKLREVMDANMMGRLNLYIGDDLKIGWQKKIDLLFINVLRKSYYDDVLPISVLQRLLQQRLEKYLCFVKQMVIVFGVNYSPKLKQVVENYSDGYNVEYTNCDVGMAVWRK